MQHIKKPANNVFSTVETVERLGISCKSVEALTLEGLNREILTCQPALFPWNNVHTQHTHYPSLYGFA